MTQVVVNKQYGGFGLSYDAVKLFFELKGWEFSAIDHETYFQYWKKEGVTINPYELKDRDFITKYRFYDGEIGRDDPALIKVVETLGEKANGDCATLVIVDIPDGVEWEIDEYDGYESVVEPRNVWG